MELLIVGLVVFLGVHSVAIVTPGWRDAQRARMGEGAWKGVFTLASVLGLVLIVYGYGLARQAPIVLYTPPGGARRARCPRGSEAQEAPPACECTSRDSSERRKIQRLCPAPCSMLKIPM